MLADPKILFQKPSIDLFNLTKFQPDLIILTPSKDALTELGSKRTILLPRISC